MNPETLLYIMASAIVVAAAAILVQAGFLFAMHRTSRAMRNEVSSLIARIEPLAETGQRLLDETRTHVAEISAKAAELMELSRTQLLRVDDVLSEATARTRTQMDRIEMVLDDTVNRFQETTALVQSSIVRPLRQINALAVGIRAMLSVLAAGRRMTVEQATHDEEMFI